MEVITFESGAFQELLRKLDEIRESLFGRKPEAMKGKAEIDSPVNEKWLTGEAVMKLLDISKRTLHQYRKDGLIGFSQVGHKIYYSAKDIDDLLERHHKAAFHPKNKFSK